MDKKVYEGYKRTSSRPKTIKVESSNPETSSAPKESGITQDVSSKKPNARLAGKTSVAKPRLAMFIDVDNVGVSRENLLEILFYANGKYQIELCKLYGFSDETLPGIRDIANEYNLVTVGKMKFKQPGINCLDSRLLVDVYECALNNKNKIDMIFLWCYPCDLTNLFKKIIDLGINTATIENSIFDCKNNFVSQTFKLYSPYDFSMEQSTYGKVKNEPSNTNIATSSNTEVTPVSSTDAGQSQTPDTNSVDSQPEAVEDVVPPVLPRRTILERSNPNAPKPKPETELETVETDAKPTSLVQEIARKLNLEIPPDGDQADGDQSETNTFEKAPDETADSNILIDLLKRAGFNDSNEEKSLKYEDTIGDL